MSSKDGHHHPPQGLGQPLVTVSKLQGSGIRPMVGNVATTPAGNDHPLAMLGKASSVVDNPSSSSPPSTSFLPPPPPRVLSVSNTSTSSTLVPPPPPPPLPPLFQSVSLPAVVSPLGDTTVMHPSLRENNNGNNNNFSMSSKSVFISHVPVSPGKKTLEDLADEFMAGPSYRTTQLKLPPILKPPVLPSNQSSLERLRTLVERRAWGDVLQVCGDMLRSVSSAYAPIYSSLIHYATNDSVPAGTNTSIDDTSTMALKLDTVEIMTLECHAWLRLRRYADLGREIARWSFCPIIDLRPESIYNSFKDSTQVIPPSWVPWSLFILAAESLQYTESDSARTLDSLHLLRDMILSSSNNKDHEYILTIDVALSNALIRKQDWRSALESLDHALSFLPNIFQSEEDKLLQAYRAEIMSRQGRILLQAGAIQQAEHIFQQVPIVSAPSSSIPNQSTIHRWILIKAPAQRILQQGMTYFARRQYSEAMTSFQQASDLLRQSHKTTTPMQSSYDPELYVGSQIWVESPEGLLSQAWNNLGLAALYTCRRKDAVHLLESLIRDNPTAYLTEQLAFNLCTLYELGSDTAVSARQKRILQLLAKRFYLHDIGPEQFRVTSI
jgi:tetratricopeptide (TPR) repeat protein